MHFAVNSPEVAKQRRWKKMCAVCLAAQQLRMGDDDGHMDTNWDACRGLCTCGGELRDTKKHTYWCATPGCDCGICRKCCNDRKR